MAELKAGIQVRLKTDPSRGGTVLDTPSITMAGRKWIRVRLLNGEENSFPIDLLEPVSDSPETPIELFKKGQFVGPDWLRRELTRIRVTGGLSDVIYSMEATETDFHAHQFKPVIKILNSPSDSLLIADEVGLGKTIEAGLIWTELRARYDLRRLLVVCPKTLCVKWQTELDHRFGVDAQIVDARDLHGLLSDDRRRQKGFAAISWIQALRPPSGYAGDGETRVPKDPRSVLARFLADKAEAEPLVDLLVIDEAHYMRNPETGAHRLARLLQPVASHKLFLSATPIHLKNRDLHSLLRLLDPDTFSREAAFEEIIAANRPLIAARDLVMRLGSSREDIRVHLAEAEKQPLLGGNQQIRIIQEMLGKDPLDLAARSAIAWRLEQANLLAHVVTRTRRRDVEEFRVVRDVGEKLADMNPVERKFYDQASAVVAEYARERTVSERFLLATPQRLLTSSPAAAAQYWASLATPENDAIDEEDITEIFLDELELDTRPLLTRLSEYAQQANVGAELEATDTKYAQLLEMIAEIKREDGANKIIVFSSFRVTLKYLSRRLRAEGYQIILLHGSVSEPRDELLTRFREDPHVDILLASEVGSEGVDLQFCWALINYDLPWNPMRVEQRIGRIDRLGQPREKVVVRNLLYRNTIDARIYERLYVRLGLCQQSLGEFEAVLGDPVREITAIVMNPALTEEEKEGKIAAAAQVLENKRTEQQRLESEAGGLMAHGDFVLEKIREARQLNRWISGEDVLVYVKDALARRYSGCEIEPVSAGSDLYSVRLNAEARADFAAFVTQRGYDGRTKLTNASSNVKCKFTSSAVRSRQRDVEIVSHFHPLVRFTSMLDENDAKAARRNAVAATVSEASAGVQRGQYVLAIARWHFGTSDGQRLGYAAHCQTRAQLLSSDEAERLAHAIAAEGRPIPNAGARIDLVSAASMLEEVVSVELMKRFESSLNQYEAELQDRTLLQLRSLDRHRQTQSEKLDIQIQRNRNLGQEGILKANEGRLRALHARCDQKQAEIETRRSITPMFSELSVGVVEVV